MTINTGTLNIQGILSAGDYFKVYEKNDDLYTKLLIHADGANGSNTLLDSASGATITNSERYDTYTKLMLHLENNVTDSATAKTVTNNNVTFVSSAGLYRFGSYSASFNGTNAYLSVPDSADWAMGTGNFTVDCWVYPTAFGSASAYRRIWCQGSDSSNNVSFAITDTGTLEFNVTSGGSNVVLMTSTTSLLLNAWHHLAIIRNGNTWSIAINGILQNTTASGTYPDLAAAFLIGSNWDLTAARLWTGYIDEFRVSKGIARWTSNFVPPAFPYGKVAVSNSPAPVFGNYCARFNGTDSYITIPSDYDWCFGSANFTIDFWVQYNNLPDSGSRYGLVWREQPSPSAYFIFMLRNNAGTFEYRLAFTYAGGTVDYTVAQTPLLNTWYHIAIVRSGSTITIYVNGTSIGSVSVGTFGLDDIAAPLGFGKDMGGGTSYLKGYMDEIRISKGIARWTANFTPPTSAYISDSNTVLLLHLNGDTIDSGNNTKVATNNKVDFNSGKFNNSSAWFDGGGNYLSLADSAVWDFRTNDFTIECLAKFSVVGSAYTQNILSHYEDPNNRWELQLVGDKLVLVFVSGGNQKGSYTMTNSGQIVKDTWYHIAVERYGTTALMFINGVSQALTATTPFNNNDVGTVAGVLAVGIYRTSDGVDALNGWIDELRISNGIARWTSNFTPPTLPYEDTWAGDTYTKLLLHSDGYDTGGTTYDNSPVPHTVGQTGDAYVTYSDKKFGYSSLYFGGTSGYWTTADSADWDFSNGDFTLDFWIKFNVLPVAANTTGIFNQLNVNSGGTNCAFNLQLDNDGTNYKWAFTWTTTGNTNDGTTVFFNWVTPLVKVWYHIAIVRSGADLKCFVNGVQIGAGDMGTQTIYNSTRSLIIGANAGNAGQIHFLNGFLDEVRITKGLARWTSNFTPYSNAYASNLTMFVITGLNGDVDEEYRIITRFIGANSAPGNAVFLRLNGDTGTNYGNQEIYGENATCGASRNTGNNGMYMDEVTDGLATLSDGILYAKSGFARYLTSKRMFRASGTTVNDFSLMGNVWNNTTDNLTYLTMHSNYASGNGIGYGSYVVVLKKAHNVTPPLTYSTGSIATIQNNTAGILTTIFEHTRAPLPSDIKLLIHGNAIADATGKTLTSVGSPTVSTGQYKYNNIGKSILFNGSTDYLTVPDSDDWYFGYGDFTIDTWLYWNSVTNPQHIYYQWVDNSNYIGFYKNGNQNLRLDIWSAGVVIGSYTGSTTLTSGTWYHIALVRKFPTFYMFVNGVPETITIGTDLGSGQIPNFLANPRILGSEYHNGYAQEYRISRRALWTSNFSTSLPVWLDYGGATTEIVIPGLNGDRDVLYEFEFRGIDEAASAAPYLYPYLRLNGDSGSNYGNQGVAGLNTSAVASRYVDTGILMGGATSDSVGAVHHTKDMLYAKTGWVRTTVGEGGMHIVGTTVNKNAAAGGCWSNTTDNITSINIFNKYANGIGVGSYLRVKALKH